MSLDPSSAEAFPEIADDLEMVEAHWSIFRGALDDLLRIGAAPNEIRQEVDKILGPNKVVPDSPVVAVSAVEKEPEIVEEPRVLCTVPLGAQVAVKGYPADGRIPDGNKLQFFVSSDRRCTILIEFNQRVYVLKIDDNEQVASWRTAKQLHPPRESQTILSSTTDKRGIIKQFIRDPDVNKADFCCYIAHSGKLPTEPELTTDEDAENSRVYLFPLLERLSGLALPLPYFLYNQWLYPIDILSITPPDAPLPLLTWSSSVEVMVEKIERSCVVVFKASRGSSAIALNLNMYSRGRTINVEELFFNDKETPESVKVKHIDYVRAERRQIKSRFTFLKMKRVCFIRFDDVSENHVINIVGTGRPYLDYKRYPIAINRRLLGLPFVIASFGQFNK